MSDRYLYRAKRIDNGEWVVGYYAVIGKDPVIINKDPATFCLSEGANERRGNEVINIKPHTLCQCIGLKDENNELIYENDICIIRSCVVDEEDGYFKVAWDGDDAQFILRGDGLMVTFDNCYAYECEVVGNTFDNPELLEGAAE